MVWIYCLPIRIGRSGVFNLFNWRPMASPSPKGRVEESQHPEVWTHAPTTIYSIISITYSYSFLCPMQSVELKVGSNEKWGGSEKWDWLGISLGLWLSMAIWHLNMQLLCKKRISFSACYSFINRWCLDKFHPFDPLCLFKMWKLQYGRKDSSAPIYWRNHSFFLENVRRI
jgi:hypothetical protein